MAGERVPVVLVPRFSTYVGSDDFWSLPIDVEAYSSIELTCWRAPLVGTTPMFRIHAMESIDRVGWEHCPGSSGDDPGADNETLYTWPLSKRWFRLRTVVGGTNPGVTWWAQGFLIKRER